MPGSEFSISTPANQSRSSAAHSAAGGKSMPAVAPVQKKRLDENTFGLLETISAPQSTDAIAPAAPPAQFLIKRDHVLTLNAVPDAYNEAELAVFRERARTALNAYRTMALNRFSEREALLREALQALIDINFHELQKPVEDAVDALSAIVRSEITVVTDAKAVADYFIDPRSIWGMKHGPLWTELEPMGFVQSAYGGTSDAHEFIKTMDDGSHISIVVNYGGGRHAVALGRATFEPAFYYKLEWPPYYQKIKVIDPRVYPAQERATENYIFYEV